MEKNLIPELRFPDFSGEWEENTVKDSFEFIRNYSYSRNKEGCGYYKHIHYGDIHSTFNGFIFKDTFVPGIVNLNNHIELINNDLLVADASEDYNDLGKALLIYDKGDKHIIAGLHTFALRASGSVLPIFFYYYSKTGYYKRFMAKVGTGTSVFGINKSNFEKLIIPTPSIVEQEKIGNFLFKLDKKIELQKNYIDKLKAKKKGLMQRIFNREVRFKDEDGNDYPEWEEKKLGDISEVLSSKRIYAKEYVDSGVPFYRSTEFINNTMENHDIFISKNKYNEIKNKFNVPKADEILISAVGTLGSIYLTKECDLPFYFKDGNLIWIRNIQKHVSPKYLTNFLKSNKIIKQIEVAVGGSSQKALTINIVNQFGIMLPCLEEQKKITNLIDNIDSKIELEENLLKKYEDLKKGLIQKMFV